MPGDRSNSYLEIEGDSAKAGSVASVEAFVDFKAGEYKKVAIEVDLTNKNLPMDWSLVAQAEGEVYIYPVDEMEVSDSWPVIGGDGREGFTRPELPLLPEPIHDSEALIEWVKTAPSFVNTEFDTKVTGGFKWVGVRNYMSRRRMWAKLWIKKSDWDRKVDLYMSWEGDQQKRGRLSCWE